METWADLRRPIFRRTPKPCRASLCAYELDLRLDGFGEFACLNHTLCRLTESKQDHRGPRWIDGWRATRRAPHIGSRCEDWHSAQQNSFLSCKVTSFFRAAPLSGAFRGEDEPQLTTGFGEDESSKWASLRVDRIAKKGQSDGEVITLQAAPETRRRTHDAREGESASKHRASVPWLNRWNRAADSEPPRSSSEIALAAAPFHHQRDFWCGRYAV